MAKFFRSPQTVRDWIESHSSAHHHPRQGLTSGRNFDESSLPPTRPQRSHTIQAGANSGLKPQNNTWIPNESVTPQNRQGNRIGHRTVVSVGGGAVSSPTFPWGASPIDSPRSTPSKHKRNSSALEDFIVGREMLLNDLKTSAPSFGTQSAVRSTPQTPRFAAQIPPSPQSSPSVQRQNSRPLESPKAPCTPWFAPLPSLHGSGSAVADLKQDGPFPANSEDQEFTKLEPSNPSTRSLIDRISRIDIEEQTPLLGNHLDTDITIHTQAVYAKPYSTSNIPKLQLPQRPNKQSGQANDGIGGLNPTFSMTLPKPGAHAALSTPPSMQPRNRDEQEREQYTYLNSVLSQAPGVLFAKPLSPVPEGTRHSTPVTVVDSTPKALGTTTMMRSDADKYSSPPNLIHLGDTMDIPIRLSRSSSQAHFAAASTQLPPTTHLGREPPTGSPVPHHPVTSTGPIIRLSPLLVRWLATNAAGTCEQDLTDWETELRYALKRVEEDLKALVRRGKQH